MFPERNLVTFTKTAYKMGTKIYTPRCWWMWVLVIPDMFILYCCYNIVINLVQHKLIISEFCRSTVHVGAAVSSAPGLTRSKARWPNQLELLIWRLLEGMCLQAHSGCPESSRSMVVGLRSPFSCRQSAGSLSEHFNGICIPCHVIRTPIFKQQPVLSRFQSLCILLLPVSLALAEKVPCF